MEIDGLIDLADLPQPSPQATFRAPPSGILLRDISRFNDEDETLFKAVAGVLKGVLSETNNTRLIGEAHSIEDVT
jgi:hypothetical protein